MYVKYSSFLLDAVVLLFCMAFLYHIGIIECAIPSQVVDLEKDTNVNIYYQWAIHGIRLVLVLPAYLLWKYFGFSNATSMSVWVMFLVIVFQRYCYKIFDDLGTDEYLYRCFTMFFL